MHGSLPPVKGCTNILIILTYLNALKTKLDVFENLTNKDVYGVSIRGQGYSSTSANVLLLFFMIAMLH